MPSLNGGHENGKTWWRSLDDLADTPEFREKLFREFPAGAADMLDSSERRAFLKVMGASLALAGIGLTGCRRWPKEHIAPFAHRPAGRVPGAPEYFATSMELGGVATGLIATSYDGRPIKIEGNPDHPSSLGATDALAQASVLELYDPDRSRHPVLKDIETGERQESRRPDFEVWASGHFGSLANARGSGLYILSEATSSPSVRDMRARVKKRFPRAEWVEYEPLHNDRELAGTKAALGAYHRPHYDFERAKIIVSLDCDFLHSHPARVTYTRQFAAGRRADDPKRSMNRLYVFESGYSLTGANADHRFPVRCQDVGAVAGRLVARLMTEATPTSGDARNHFAEATPDALGVTQQAFEQILSDLQQHRGECLVVAGPRQPAAVHTMAYLMNDLLGNIGRTVHFTELPDAQPNVAAMKSLAQDMAGGRVSTLVILGGNPAHDAPANLGFAEFLPKVRTTVHLSLYDNETSRLCTWHVPRAHYLESWGDARAWDGTLGIVQPLIQPLFGGLTPIELLALITEDEKTAGYDIVRRTFAEEVTKASDWERIWRRTLHEGLLAGSAHSPITPTVDRDAALGAAESFWWDWSPPDGSTLELVYTAGGSVHDGRFANNGWLLELPDPLTKLTWDNAVLMAPEAADGIGAESGDMVNISLGDRQVTAAVYVMPGQHPRSVILPLGWGRQAAGTVGVGAGFDFYPLRSSEAMEYAAGATIEKTRGSYTFAITQDHHALDAVGRAGTEQRLPTILREATLAEYRQDPKFARHRSHVTHRLSLWPETSLEGAQYAWGMSIDLAACTGCSACIVACQAENNIPVVGKDQVIRGREMHWIRVDRYFKGDPDAPEAVGMQPVPCMHCENAACEQVCPVAATTHDKDGLNVMVYNRCIGTRYCSNNCPYKVRRFNYFDYQVRRPIREEGLLAVDTDYYTRPPSDVNLLKQMQFNPEVTVRSRGVMEKCTFCLQRIADAKIKAKNAWVDLPQAAKQRDPRVTVLDDDINTACAQACPAGAIVFGDLNDPSSEVAATRRHDRHYEMLEELNAKPRTTYLANLRNPAPGLGDATPSSAGEEHHG
ncbi:MAG: TAT-variant-translocated molybdopterin oxidoreductase [Planctomycetota bacterium]|jgi:molybdopterin-containing oxidoreductase family iron-sulfur binding subunit